VNTTPPGQHDRKPTVTGQRWHTDLTRRVQRFRRRRANLQGASDTQSTLEFDFEQDSGTETDTIPSRELMQAAPPGEEFDVVLRAGEELGEDSPALDSIPLRPDAESVDAHRPIDAEPGPDGLQLETRRRRLDPGEISIVTESSSVDELGHALSSVPVAPLGQRFWAGVADGLLLLLALAFFVAIFWWVVGVAGGSLHWRSTHLGALGFVAGLSVLAYFALFGRLASATPGQQAAGLVLRSLDGGAPTSGQAFWRAFGYLVSFSALMLGFVWALVDNEALTWHDRMSRTFLANGKPK
jgi:uncharacterized RDD family membrane protein YckC